MFIHIDHNLFRLLDSKKPSWLHFQSSLLPDFTLYNYSPYYCILNDPDQLLQLSISKTYSLHPSCFLQGRESDRTLLDMEFVHNKIVDMNRLEWQFIKRKDRYYIIHLPDHRIPLFVLSFQPISPYIPRNQHMKTYVIALKDRRDAVLEILHGNGWTDVEVVDAKRGEKTANMSAGQMGCLRSHLEVYERIKNNDDPSAIILEDDVVFRNGLRFSPLQMIEKRRNQVSQLDSMWDLYFLGRCWDFCFINSKTQSPDIVRTFHSYCSHAYMIQKKVLFQPFMYEDIKVPIDQFWHSHLSNLRAYACQNPIVFQNPFQKSSIGYPIHPGELPVCCEHIFSRFPFIYLLTLLILFLFLLRII